MDGPDAIKYIIDNNIQGDIVECGVESGNFEYIWINELTKRNELRNIYLYDTFAGLTAPGEHDYTCDDAKIFKMDNDTVYKTWKANIIENNKNAWCCKPLEYVKNRLSSTGYPENYLHYIVGDVMVTLNKPENIPEKIAILRLDTDWYDSSKFELEKLFKNVVNGGIVIFDDYYHWNGQRKATDDFFKKIGVDYYFFNIGNGRTSAIIKK